MTFTPILNGPPAFITLVLLMAVAAYLRQEITMALDRGDLIKRGDVWNYPLGESHTDMRLKSLEDTRAALNRVFVPVMVFGIVLIARILFQSVLTLVAVETSFLMRLVDTAIVAGMFIVFLVLLRMYKAARKRDEEIIKITREWERDHPPALFVSCKTQKGSAL